MPGIFVVYPKPGAEFPVRPRESPLLGLFSQERRPVNARLHVGLAVRAELAQPQGLAQLLAPLDRPIQFFCDRSRTTRIGPGRLCAVILEPFSDPVDLLRRWNGDQFRLWWTRPLNACRTILVVDPLCALVCEQKRFVEMKGADHVLFIPRDLELGKPLYASPLCAADDEGVDAVDPADRLDRFCEHFIPPIWRKPVMRLVEGLEIQVVRHVSISGGDLHPDGDKPLLVFARLLKDLLIVMHVDHDVEALLKRVLDDPVHTLKERFVNGIRGFFHGVV